MTHEEIQQLAALDAIDAATPEEVAELRRHLETCSECRRAANEFDETAALIALSADPVAPPSPVRHQLLREIGRFDRARTEEMP
ncbi:MAG TPA: zf-HC2 domain-containing protein, partial [Thermoanaerobaculia bacterium]